MVDQVKFPAYLVTLWSQKQPDLPETGTMSLNASVQFMFRKLRISRRWREGAEAADVLTTVTGHSFVKFPENLLIDQVPVLLSMRTADYLQY